jgi:hypothetical protein
MSWSHGILRRLSDHSDRADKQPLPTARKLPSCCNRNGTFSKKGSLDEIIQNKLISSQRASLFDAKSRLKSRLCCHNYLLLTTASISRLYLCMSFKEQICHRITEIFRGYWHIRTKFNAALPQVVVYSQAVCCRECVRTFKFCIFVGEYRMHDWA